MKPHSHPTKTIPYLLVVLAVVLAPVALTARAETLDAILATVDDREVILYSDIMAEVAPAVEVMRASLTPTQLQDEVDKLVRLTIDEAIENRILLRRALLAGLQTNAEAIDKRVVELALAYPEWSHSELRSLVRRQALARQMAVLKRQQFENAAVVSETEVAQYYADHRQEVPFTHPERLRLRQIFLSAHGETPEERRRIRAQLDEIRDEIEAGGDFARLAVAHSEAVGAKQGGIIGWITSGDLVPTLEEAAFALDAGPVSDVLETEGGFHILKVETREPAGVRPLDEARADIEPILRGQQAKERYRKWLADQRKRSRVQIFR